MCNLKVSFIPGTPIATSAIWRWIPNKRKIYLIIKMYYATVKFCEIIINILRINRRDNSRHLILPQNHIRSEYNSESLEIIVLETHQVYKRKPTTQHWSSLEIIHGQCHSKAHCAKESRAEQSINGCTGIPRQFPSKQLQIRMRRRVFHSSGIQINNFYNM
jgi:hypothetical protein